MEIITQSHLSTENYLIFNAHQWDVIYIRNSGTFTPLTVKEYSKSILELLFDDIDCPFGNYVMPSKIDVQRAIEFCENKEKIIVSCRNGNTRAPSIAYVCKCKKLDPKQAIRTFSPGRHHLNEQIISYGAELLNNQNIYNAYENYFSAHLYKVFLGTSF